MNITPADYQLLENHRLNRYHSLFPVLQGNTFLFISALDAGLVIHYSGERIDSLLEHLVELRYSAWYVLG